MAKKMKGGVQNMQRAQGAMQGKNNKQQMEAAQKRLQSMGQGLPGGADLASMMKMFGGGGQGGGAPGAGGGFPGAGGMPDMASLMQMMGRGGGMPGMGRGRR